MLIRLLAVVLAAQATLSVRTVLVVIPVTVTDGRGDRVTGLTQESFRLFEDGRPQPITVFQHGITPITLGLVVDHSTSMRGNLPRVTAALSTFAASAQPDDEMFAVDFNEHVSVPFSSTGEPFTHDVGALTAAVASLPALGQTALYDAVIVGLDGLKQGRWDKRTLVIVSDGGDNASKHTLDDVRALARESDAVIYAIGLQGESLERAPRVLKRLAEETGGIAYFPDSPDDVSRVLREIVQDLREHYSLGFAPDEIMPGLFRKIDVSVTTPDGRRLRVRTREGYVIPGERP